MDWWGDSNLIFVYRPLTMQAITMAHKIAHSIFKCFCWLPALCHSCEITAYIGRVPYTLFICVLSCFMVLVVKQNDYCLHILYSLIFMEKIKKGICTKYRLSWEVKFPLPCCTKQSHQCMMGIFPGYHVIWNPVIVYHEKVYIKHSSVKISQESTMR